MPHLLSATIMKFSNLKRHIETINNISHQKVVNNEIASDEALDLTNHLKIIHHLISLTIITMLVLEH